MCPLLYLRGRSLRIVVLFSYVGSQMTQFDPSDPSCTPWLLAAQLLWQVGPGLSPEMWKAVPCSAETNKPRSSADVSMRLQVPTQAAQPSWNRAGVRSVTVLLAPAQEDPEEIMQDSVVRPRSLQSAREKDRLGTSFYRTRYRFLPADSCRGGGPFSSWPC